jgi:hypothetical protein
MFFLCQTKAETKILLAKFADLQLSESRSEPVNRTSKSPYFDEIYFSMSSLRKRKIMARCRVFLCIGLSRRQAGRAKIVHGDLCSQLSAV